MQIDPRAMKMLRNGKEILELISGIQNFLLYTKHFSYMGITNSMGISKNYKVLSILFPRTSILNVTASTDITTVSKTCRYTFNISTKLLLLHATIEGLPKN